MAPARQQTSRPIAAATTTMTTATAAKATTTTTTATTRTTAATTNLGLQRGASDQHSSEGGRQAADGWERLLDRVHQIGGVRTSRVGTVEERALERVCRLPRRLLTLVSTPEKASKDQSWDYIVHHITHCAIFSTQQALLFTSMQQRPLTDGVRINSCHIPWFLLAASGIHVKSFLLVPSGFISSKRWHGTVPVDEQAKLPLPYTPGSSRTSRF